MVFLFLLNLFISFISISIQTKFSGFQELLTYSSLTSKQIMMNDDLRILSFLGSKAFVYKSIDVFGTLPTITIPEYTLINNNYMNDNMASVMIKLTNGEYLMACSDSQHLEQFDETGTSKITLTRSTAFDQEIKCSINEIDPNLYLLSYASSSTPIKYYIETFVANNDINQIVKIKTYSMDGFSSPIICKTFLRLSTDLIFCIYSDVSLYSILFDALLYPKIPKVKLATPSNTHYTLYPIGEESMLVFGMTEKTSIVANRPIATLVYYNNTDQSIQTNTEINIIDSSGTIDYYCPLVISKLSSEMFIAGLCDLQFVYVRRYFNNLLPEGPTLRFNSGTNDVSFISISVFTLNILGIISSHGSLKNYLIALEFPICETQSLMIQSAGIVKLTDLAIGSNPAFDPRIIFSTKSSNVIETNPILGINIEYALTTEFTFIEGGVFSYSFTLIEQMDGNDASSIPCSLTVDVCNNRCLTCIKYGDDLDNQCLTCSPGYHLDLAYPNQCLNTPPSDGSFLDPNDNTIKECYVSCATCSDAGTSTDTNCDSCDTSAYYEHPTELKQCVNIQIENYFIDLINQRYSPCYSICSFCSGSGSPQNNMCTACKSGYNLNGITFNCINVCVVNNQNIYFDLSLSHFCTPSKECIVEKPFLITTRRECVATCPDDDECIKLCPLCPINTYPNSYNCACVTDDDIEAIVANEQLGIISIENGEISFNWRNSTIELLKSSTQFKTDSNTSWFGSDEVNKIKLKAGIPLTDDIIIYKQDIYNEGTLVNDIIFSFYYENTTKMKISDYDEEGLLMSFPIRDTTSLEYLQGKMLYDRGIDATDPNHPFFTHICYEFQTGNNTDIPRRDKYDYYLMDKSKLCPKKCSFESIDFDKNISNCRCHSTEETNTLEKSFEEIKASFILSIFDANWEVIICDMLVFNNKIISTNIGHWFVLAMLILSIANFIVFTYDNFKPLEQYLKSMQSNISNKDNNHSKYNNSNGTFNKNFKANSSSQSNKINASNDITDSPGLGIKSGIGAIGVNSSLQVINEPNQSYVYSNIKQNSSSFNEKKYTFVDYKKMSFEEILLKDKRTFIKHYWDCLKLAQPIIYTFFINSKMTIPTIKIAVFTIGITIDFSLSAFFFSDKYISKIYRGEQNFFYSLPISIYTYIVRSVFGLSFYFLTASSSQIDKIQLKNNGKNKEIMSNNFLKWYQIRIIIFFSFKFALLIFFWYYTSAFCGTYKNSQTNWIISGFTSLAISQAFPFVVALVYTGLIEVAIKQKVKFVYRIYNLI